MPAKPSKLALERRVLRAIKLGDEAKLLAVIASGASLNPSLREQVCLWNMPLFSAIRYRRPEILKILLEHGASHCRLPRNFIFRKYLTVYFPSHLQIKPSTSAVTCSFLFIQRIEYLQKPKHFY
jgi:hypothetical protein